MASSNSTECGDYVNSTIVEREIGQLSNLVVTAVLYPIEYAKVLIQLGHEPIAPRASTTLFGKPALILPNVFQYIRHIKKTDGFMGCYNGLSARLLGNIAAAYFSQKLIRQVGLNWVNEDDPPNIEEGEEADANQYFRLTRISMVNHTASIIISYPFQVVSIRMMASFIGKEEHYGNLLSAISSIFQDNGFAGFYRGIIPKLLGELSCIAVAGYLAYLINKYLLKTKEHRGHTVQLMTFVASTFTYPLTVVSTCMAVSDSSLTAGQPPLMPLYPGWCACLRDLLQNGQHKRGGSLIFRYYIAPRNRQFRY